jgi:hypothetical protein
VPTHKLTCRSHGLTGVAAAADNSCTVAATCSHRGSDMGYRPQTSRGGTGVTCWRAWASAVHANGAQADMLVAMCETGVTCSTQPVHLCRVDSAVSLSSLATTHAEGQVGLAGGGHHNTHAVMLWCMFLWAGGPELVECVTSWPPCRVGSQQGCC